MSAPDDRLRITLVHLLTDPTALRERRSIAEVAAVADVGIDYVQHRNPPRTATPPRDTCRRPDAVTSWEDASFPNDWQLGPGHFGCFLAHRRAMFAEFDDTLDLFVVCECDCLFEGTAAEFLALLHEARDHMARTGTLYVSLGIGWKWPDRPTLCACRAHLPNALRRVRSGSSHRAPQRVPAGAVGQHRLLVQRGLRGAAHGHRDDGVRSSVLGSVAARTRGTHRSLMPYSIPLRCLFIHVPKNAGTSVTEALRLDVGLPGHRTWREYEGRCIAPDGTPYFSFAVVRDPLDRLVSNYDYARMHRSLYHAVDGPSFSGVHPDSAMLATMTLDECVAVLAERPAAFAHPGWGAQHPYVLDEHGAGRVDLLCRFEHLGADLERVCDVLDLAPLRLPHLNRSAACTGRSERGKRRLGPRARVLAEQHFADDIERFGYRTGVDQPALLDALCSRHRRRRPQRDC